MIYLKTIFSTPSEIKYLKLNIRESQRYIDRFIVCEYNRTHIGEDKELIFKKYLEEFTPGERAKIMYIGADISKEAPFAKFDKDLMHKNEQLMRGYFAHQIDLKDKDIVISLDADEIIFENAYDKILGSINFLNPATLLTLHQFFYRINYLWQDEKFIAPTACRAKFYKNKYPAQWRYEGKKFSEIVGCHFSWCLTIDEMLRKLNMYAHHQDYGHLAQREILEQAIREKKYPFDPNRDFRIEVLDPNKDKGFYPQSIFGILEDFNEVIAE